MSAMKRLFQLMADKKASDIFMSVGSPINIKINGTAIPVNQTAMDANGIMTLLNEVISDKQKKEFEDTLELNTAASLEGVGNFRISAFRQKNSPAVVVRFIPGTIPAFDTLNLPAVLKEIIMEKRGLILMVGATGSGKSTSIAAMINHRNEISSDHIVTIEDPIEFLHTNKRSIVNQREVGLDTKSFARALRGVMRAAPDVILIGEIRDRETMEAAISLAGTGHLVLSTLHANNTAETLDRIINMFPNEQHKQVFLDLSQYLRAIMSQRLVVGKDGKRMAAIEVMLNTPYITELVKKGDVSGIKEAIVASSERGVQSFDMALLTLYKQNRIDLEEALANADSRSNLEAKINFG